MCESDRIKRWYVCPLTANNALLQPLLWFCECNDYFFWQQEVTTSKQLVIISRRKTTTNLPFFCQNPKSRIFKKCYLVAFFALRTWFLLANNEQRNTWKKSFLIGASLRKHKQHTTFVGNDKPRNFHLHNSEQDRSNGHENLIKCMCSVCVCVYCLHVSGTTTTEKKYHAWACHYHY